MLPTTEASQPQPASDPAPQTDAISGHDAWFEHDHRNLQAASTAFTLPEDKFIVLEEGKYCNP
jgi:hypothetical protein